MRFTLKTDSGKAVRLTDAMLLDVENAPGAEPNRTELCAVMNVNDDLAAAQVDGGQAWPTRLGFVVDGDTAFALLNVLCGSTLLFTVLDLAEPATQELLLQAPRSGFAFAVVGTAAQKLLRVPVGHLRSEIAEWCKAATQADFETRAALMAFVLRRINDAEGLQTLGLQELDFDEVLLSFANAAGSPSLRGESVDESGLSQTLH